MKQIYPILNGTYKLSKEDIEFESSLVIASYDAEILNEPKPTPIELIIEHEGLNLRYKKLSNDLSILGAMVFNDGALCIYEDNEPILKEFKSKDIIIDSNLVDNDDKRLRFTYAHELGHYITQYDIEHVDENQLSLDLFEPTEKMIASICKRENIKENYISKSKKELKTKVDWQEWQANYFASCILIPKSTLDKYLEPYFKSFNIMDPEPLLGKLNKNELDDLVKDISNAYDVSQEMTLNRLKSLEYI